MMNYEVEQKFPVDDMPLVENRLAELGTSIGNSRREVDLYFAHPARDFRHTDEALRIRRVGERNCLTYKGPKIDPTTKTRRELELPLLPGEESAAGWESLLEALGFQPAGEVRKRRRKAQVLWEGRDVEASLDDVEGVGTFVELELIAATAGEIDAAKACIASLATTLGLSGSERRSYLELLLEVRSGSQSPRQK